MGFAWVIVLLVVIVGLIAAAAHWNAPHMAFGIVPLVLVWLVSLFGFIVNGPNQARVVQLFGKYMGTIREVGFFYGNPFYWRTRVSMRVRTFSYLLEISTPELAPSRRSLAGLARWFISMGITKHTGRNILSCLPKYVVSLRAHTSTSSNGRNLLSGMYGFSVLAYGLTTSCTETGLKAWRSRESVCQTTR